MDFDRLALLFDTFVHSLNDLVESTPAENFSTRHLASHVEDRAVIAKVLKRMRLKDQLSWMDQYLKDENGALRPAGIDPSKDSELNIAEPDRPTAKNRTDPSIFDNADATYANIHLPKNIEDLAKVQSLANNLDKSVWPPPLPPINDPALLKQAFTHRSYATACAPAQSSKVFLTSLHNERLEFLGDSFLNHSVTKMLFARMPDSREGEMSLLRAELIGNNTAAGFGRSYDFDKQLLLNDTAERDGVRKTPKVIADTFEAYLGALILDGRDGVIRADNWLKALMEPRIVQYLNEKTIEPVNTYAKQKLWNHFVKKYPSVSNHEDGTAKPAIVVKYEWVDGGGGNEGGFIVAAKLYVVSQKIDGQELGRGFGLNKKEAEHRAAMAVVKTLGLI